MNSRQRRHGSVREVLPTSGVAFYWNWNQEIGDGTFAERSARGMEVAGGH